MASTFEEAAAARRAAVSARQADAAKKAAAALQNPSADVPAQNAANPTWVGGFDEKLGVKRTT